ncbi:MAG: 4-hydroxy-3-methylbut-2-enyl diphosphate reductase [Smithellaceae bacterium]|jgi:4-hydroxy-3-methylbut-2-enyl diphosphate reductase|nr:4-hydroxy-3-methylbut-2-enyl diphosphate reductase [Smithellaceae bacterium]MDD3259130.1 4-hydroxy-3-methylbut-2-enyl diphosphate reductase [Smithellaceae bacterium]MDD3849169.1 4-hydroxy-3-methylbut-2-enyl diphosphate reductase [Smithellaceae bacterium]
MEIKLAKTAGFCMGVRRAVDTVLDVSQHETGRKIYTYGPLIHNPQTIELLKNRGITAIKHIDEIADPKNALLVIRAHGIAPGDRRKIKESGVKIIDATCPKVGYVQAIIKKHTALDYTVVIAGDREHPEVDGLWGYTEGRGVIVSTLEDAEKIPAMEKVCIVAQTTQDSDHYREIVRKIQKKNPRAVVFNTICSSTEKRQEEIISLAAEMDALFVVGGKNSANTRRLADLARKQNTTTFHIETVRELKNIDLGPYKSIGVSAGASTPNWIIDQITDHLAEKKSRPNKKTAFLLNLWLWMVKTDFYSALGAGCLALAGMLLQNIPLSVASIAVASFFVYAMHVLNRLVTSKESGLIGSFREPFYLRHEKMFCLAAFASLLVALLLSLTGSIYAFGLLLFISAAGGIYNMKLLPGNRRFGRLRDIPGSKNFFTAVAWGIVTAVLPALSRGWDFSAGMAVAFIFTFVLVFIRSAMSDIIDMQSDRLLGRETIPVIIGKEKTQALLKIILLILLAILIIAPIAGWSPTLSIFLVLCVLYVWICFGLCDRRAGFSGATIEGLLETSYIIAGFAVLGWLVFRWS